MGISIQMPQPHNLQSPVSVRLMWLKHGPQIILNTMVKRKISYIKVALCKMFQECTGWRMEQDRGNSTRTCMCIHVTHVFMYMLAYTHTKHKFFANLVLNNSAATPCEYAVNSICLSEHGAKCQREASWQKVHPCLVMRTQDLSWNLPVRLAYTWDKLSLPLHLVTGYND
jgi:hypothetical protein